MQLTGPASEITVARYDDDYPLLYGEPAVQPRWERLAAESGACGAPDARTCATESECDPAKPCESCGRSGDR